MFLGVNMFLALLRAHFNPRLLLRLKWAWVGKKHICTREHQLYCYNSILADIYSGKRMFFRGKIEIARIFFQLSRA